MRTRTAQDLHSASSPAMVPVWLAALLTPLCETLEPHPTGPSPPITNLRVDARLGRVTWDLSGHVEEVTCFAHGMRPSRAKGSTFCQFYALPFCKTTTYTVKVTRGPPFSMWVQYPEPGGDSRAAAANLTCWVHDVDILECSWTVGPAAPSDVQYHLLLREPSSPTEWACPHYRADARGVHTGCRFRGLVALDNRHYHFLVTGRSPSAASVPCAEIFSTLSSIETLGAPRITHRCNASRSFLLWTMVSHFSWNWVFELQIWKDSDPLYTETVTVLDKSTHELVNPGPFAVRIRVRNRLASEAEWSSWGPAQRFECSEDRSPKAWQAAAASAVGSVLLFGALAVLLGRSLLSRRFSVPRKLFPPIPQVAGALQDFLREDFLRDDRLVVWEARVANSEDCPVEKVQAVKETRAPPTQSPPSHPGELPP